MNAAKKIGAGRPNIAEGDESKHVGLKMPKKLERKFIDKAKELRALGIRTNKSELIRVLAEYWLDNAEEIFTERAKNE